uniref:Uncharacterized protein n=1 Tax=Anguilla anguilla TaxID=7936 RepID=A0A0E9PAB6_ANGAN
MPELSLEEAHFVLKVSEPPACNHNTDTQSHTRNQQH